MPDMDLQSKRSKVLDAVREYHEALASKKLSNQPVRVSGKVFDAAELLNLVDASLDFWLTSGRYTAAFEQAFAQYLGVRWAGVVNSGSSANLLALTALTSKSLGDRRLVPGDEVITVAAGFPTTVNPILQAGAVPVFVDVQLPEYNINPRCLQEALTGKTKAIMLAHTLGNPFDLKSVKSFADANGLWLIEDACDALGSEYEDRMIGTFGDIATFSFYPAHHITMGEGGAVVTNNGKLQKIITSLRDWGRDCWCETGHDDTCGKRFDWRWPNLPDGYDHKYVYSHRGFNLKATDMQAAIGLAQLEKLPDFIQKRRHNFSQLNDLLSDLSADLVLPEPTPGSNPSWFGYPITLRDETTLDRTQLTQYLNDKGIHTRLLFGGNLTKQPYMAEETYRISGSLDVTDKIMNRTFWVGVYPALTRSDLERIATVIREFIHLKRD